jgi:hypothetical protein
MTFVPPPPPTTKSSGTGTSIIISDLPLRLRNSVAELNLDVNGDGALDTEEIVMAVENLAATSRDNVGLKKIIYGLCVFALLLIGCVFGATIAAARLTNDTEVDSATGIMYAKGGSHETMKTEDVIIYSDSVDVVDMSNDELNQLKVILLEDGDVKFTVKGFARPLSSTDSTEVKLLVEGGTITYDNAGIVSSTGDAKELLDYAYGITTNITGRRLSSTAQQAGSGTSGNSCCNKFGQGPSDCCPSSF